MKRPVRSADERFWSKVDRTGECWEWRGFVALNGYGRFTEWAQRKHFTAHRFAYESAIGPIPAGLLACHHCDNRRCVRPSHIFLGTHLDNVRDMDRKGRRVNAPRSGPRPDQASLTEQQVREMVAWYRLGGVLQRELAAHYGVHQAHVGAILLGRRWGHLNLVPCVPKGKARNRNFRLTPEAAVEIRALRGQVVCRVLAERYGVSEATISLVQRGGIWKAAA